MFYEKLKIECNDLVLFKMEIQSFCAVKFWVDDKGRTKKGKRLRSMIVS